MSLKRETEEWLDRTAGLLKGVRPKPRRVLENSYGSHLTDCAVCLVSNGSLAQFEVDIDWETPRYKLREDELSPMEIIAKVKSVTKIRGEEIFNGARGQNPDEEAPRMEAPSKQGGASGNG